MKKLFLSTLCSLCMLFIISCNKDNQTSEISQTSQPVNKAIMALKTSEARKSSFADQLTNEEKIQFVESRLNAVTEELKLDAEQLSVLNELKPFLKPDLYVRDSKLNKEAIQFDSVWKEKARKVFSKEQLNYIFSFNTLSELKTNLTNVNIKSTTRAGAEDCDCSTKSDWCSGGNCGGPACAFQSYACGTLYLYHCDGTCR
ncbi:bacteriocin fulvocin C-related protein [Sphingobacterium siyangense]|jgi:hypothetical protein|uniref:bacteriocin fulvocin C-related protein n=1 Tax=Sphingobacterium siyangense TaxID=459529 RepID=UPI0031F87DDC